MVVFPFLFLDKRLLKILVCDFLESEIALIVSNLSVSISDLSGVNYNSSKILLISLVSGPFIFG